MKVLITGGMGVIGAEASRRFVQEGHRPVIFARHRDEWLIRDILGEVDIELGDVLDMPRLLDVIKRHRITHIVHAAAFVGAVSAANPALSVQVNVMGMVNVLEAARAFDVTRVVYTSAKGVYGPALGEYGAPTYRPVPEDHPKNPKRIYDSAKLMAEQVGLYYQANMGMDVVVLRFATTYGPGKTARHGKMGVTSQIVENPANGLPFRLPQGGDEKDDFIYWPSRSAFITRPIWVWMSWYCALPPPTDQGRLRECALPTTTRLFAAHSEILALRALELSHRADAAPVIG